MQQRPVIGIPTQTLQSIDHIPADLPESWVMNQRYFLACTSVGAVPWMVPLLDEDPATVRAIYDRLDGIFLAGGVDMDPQSYGEALHELTGRTDPPRDTVELLLARWAMEDGKPLFGVCRGMQVINVAAGGTLVQDYTLVPGTVKHDYFPGAGWARDYLAHDLRVAEGSRLHDAFGATQVKVNSMHHQGIDRMGAELAPAAWAPDGLLEAVEGTREDHWLVGVQWHPEMLIDTHAGTRRLFESFIQAANRYHESAALV